MLRRRPCGVQAVCMGLLAVVALSAPLQPEIQRESHHSSDLDKSRGVGESRSTSPELAVDPPKVWNARALDLAQDGNLRAAAKEFVGGIELYPSNVMLINNYGVVLMRMGQLDDAKLRFAEALQLDPTHDDALRNKADLERYLDSQERKGSTSRGGSVISKVRKNPSFHSGLRRSPLPPSVRLRRTSADEKLVQAMASTVDQSSEEDLSYFDDPDLNDPSRFQHTVRPLRTVHVRDWIRGGPRAAPYVLGSDPFRLVGLPELHSWGGPGIEGVSAEDEASLGTRGPHPWAGQPGADDGTPGAWRNLSLPWFEARFPSMTTDAYPHNMEASAVSPWMVPLQQAADEYRRAPEETLLRRSPRRPQAVYLQLNLAWEQWQQVRRTLGVLPRRFEADQQWLRACLPDDHLRNEFLRSTHWKMALLGSRGAGMFNHWDVIRTSSWQVQVRGHKRWHLCAPAQRGNMYDAGRVDTFRPDYQRAPRFRGARCYLDTVGPGEAIYYPMDWWHQTESLDETVSVSASIADELTHAHIRAELRQECRPGGPERISSASRPMCAALERCYGWWHSAFEGGAVAADNSTRPGTPAWEPAGGGQLTANASAQVGHRLLQEAWRADRRLQTMAGLLGEGKRGAAAQGFEEREAGRVLAGGDRGEGIPETAVNHTAGAPVLGRGRLGIGVAPSGWGSWPLVAAGMVGDGVEVGVHRHCARAPTQPATHI